jgi:hypothetical protein
MRTALPSLLAVTGFLVQCREQGRWRSLLLEPVFFYAAFRVRYLWAVSSKLSLAAVFSRSRAVLVMALARSGIIRMRQPFADRVAMLEFLVTVIAKLHYQSICLNSFEIVPEILPHVSKN